MALTKRILIFGTVVVLGVLIYFLSTATFAATVVDPVNITSIPPITSTLTSNRYTQMDDLREIDDNPYTNLDDHELIGTNDNNTLALYVHPEHLSIRVVNLVTGYIWASNMAYDYLDENHDLYNPNDINSDLYNNPDYDWDANRFVRRDRSPIVIQYYNTLASQINLVSEYFFETTRSATFIYNELTDNIGFQASITMPITNIRLMLYVYIDDDGLHVEIPFDSIENSGIYRIATISAYPLFGFTKEDFTPGYVMVPDGIGALMRYGSGNRQTYSKRFYGPDLALGQSSVEESLYAGVYGLAQGINQNGLLAVVENGAANGSLIYQPADQASNFNTVALSFEYRRSYQQRLNASGSRTIERIQDEMNQFDIKVGYYFLSADDANYVGMANKYREVLISKNVNLEQQTGDNIPFHLEVLAAENRPAVFGHEVFTMTTATQLSDILDTLNGYGIEHIDVSLVGWNRGGYGESAPNYGRIESKFGNQNQITALNNIEYATIYYGMENDVAYQRANRHRSSDIVQTIGGTFITDMTESVFLIRPQSALRFYESDYQSLSNYPISNFALLTLGSMLTSDHSSGNVSRSQQLEVIKQFLDVAESTLVHKPFDYLWGADVIADIPLYSSQQMKFTDTVPFIPLVLSGYQTVYGRSSNFFANTSNELLRMIDYNIYPSFYATHESAHLLLNTSSQHIFTSRFTDWQGEMNRQYHLVNGALKHVIGEHLVSRVIVEPGVVQNTYSNGVQILINYTGEDKTVDGHSVVAIGYEVIL